MTKISLVVIIFKRLRECWNGRQARLRCVWLRRVGSSPISRTKNRIPFAGYPVFCSTCSKVGLKRIKPSGGPFYFGLRIPSSFVHQIEMPPFRRHFFLVDSRRFVCIFAPGKNKCVATVQPMASNSPPDYCILGLRISSSFVYQKEAPP